MGGDVELTPVEQGEPQEPGEPGEPGAPQEQGEPQEFRRRAATASQVG